MPSKSHCFAFAGYLLAVALLAEGASAQTCAPDTPAFGAPPEIWQTFEPLDTGQLPARRDTTYFNGFQFPNSANPLWIDVDSAENLVFTTANHGFHIWDITTEAQKQDPQQVAVVDVWLGGVPQWIAPGEEKTLGSDGELFSAGGGKLLFAFTSKPALTLWEIDAADPANPRLLYEDFRTAYRFFGDVKMLSSGGRIYAFVAQGDGLHLYDVTAARSLSSCVENSSAQRTCGGVYVRRIDSLFAGRLALIGNYLVRSQGFSDVLIYDISNPQSPSLVTSIPSSARVLDVEVWDHNGAKGLAIKDRNTLKIWDATQCFSGGSCAALRGTPVLQRTLANGIQERLNASKSGGSTYLYLSSNRTCAGRQDDIEVFYNVSNLAGIQDITPTLRVDTDHGVVNLLEWYYTYQAFSPHGGVFVGPYFYRANYAVFDVLELKAQNPQVAVTGAAEVFRDDVNAYTASAQFCDDASGVWTFTSSDATLPTGSGSVRSFAWPSVGNKTVTVTNSACLNNLGQPVQGTLQVNVKAPEPAISALWLCPPGGNPSANACELLAPGANPAAAREVCQVLEFAADVSGKETLNRTWQLLDANSLLISPPGSGTGARLLWDTKNRSVNGETVTLSLALANQYPPQAVQSRAIELTPLQPLGYRVGDGNPCPLGEEGPCVVQTPVDGASVVGHANSQGASQWKWEFRRAGEQAWTLHADFGTGQAVQSFPPFAQGDWEIQSTLRSCQPTIPDQTATVAFTVENILIADFAPVCFLNVCEFSEGSSVPFNDKTIGNPVTYEYDFFHTSPSESTCVFSETSSSPIRSKVYSFAGTFFPCLRVTDAVGGRDVDVITAGIAVVRVAPPPSPASISASCSPSPASTGQLVSCFATASNCSPSSSGWSWSAAGASSFSGSRNLSQVNISWADAGFFTVSASNSACGSASGAASVNVVAPPPNSLGVTITPVCGFRGCQYAAGATVNFGITSTGDPTSYRVDFENPTPSASACNFGSATTNPPSSHHYPLAGRYYPCVSASKAGETVVAIYSAGLTIEGPPPSIAAQCSPSTVATGVTTHCTATAQNCSPGAAEWSWSAPGGSIVGTASSSAIDVLWNDVGTKSVTASSVKCGSASDIEAVIVIEPPLVADFEVVSGEPHVGTPTTLSATEVENASYLWELGDSPLGDALRTGSVSQPLVSTDRVITVDFDAIGTYSVKLTVTLGANQEIKEGVVDVLGPCVRDDSTHCFQSGRFSATINWKAPDGGSGVGLVSPVFADDSGLFSFFNPTNPELLVKVLDGCGITGSYWAFLAAATSLEYELTVTDMMAGESTTYFNQQRQRAQPVTDTEALSTCEVVRLHGTEGSRLAALVESDLAAARGGNTAAASGPTRPVDRLAVDVIERKDDARVVGVGTGGTGTNLCEPSATTLCALDGRFEVEVDFDALSGEHGLARRSPFVTDASAVYYFFNPSNWEMLVKVLDGCSITGSYWVFSAAATNVEYTLRVRDASTGAVQEYRNPQGTLGQAINDTAAFPCQ